MGAAVTLIAGDQPRKREIPSDRVEAGAAAAKPRAGTMYRAPTGEKRRSGRTEESVW